MKPKSNFVTAMNYVILYLVSHERIFMKKPVIITASIIACLAIAGGIIFFTTRKPASETNNISPNGDQSISDNSVLDELSAPSLEWWDLYNPNGFDTLTAVIYNNNSVAVDFTYDVVYYKNGVEVKRGEGYYNHTIPAGTRDAIWANYDIPKSNEVDEIRLENPIVTKSYNAPISGKYEFLGMVDTFANYRFTFDKAPTLATITFLHYNDVNKNGKSDKGEIVVTDVASLTEQTGEAGFETDGYDFTDTEIFIKAY